MNADDDRLRDRLRTADPASSLPPLPGGTSSALLDRASADIPRRSRRPLVIVGAGALALAAAAGVFAVLPRADTGPVLTLTAAAPDLNAICATLDSFAPQALARSEVALAGTVTSTADGVVEIRPDTFYRGGPASVVRLRADEGGGAALDGAVLRDGEQVLIAATGGQVATCGLSAAASPALQAYYDAAFG